MTRKEFEREFPYIGLLEWIDWAVKSDINQAAIFKNLKKFMVNEDKKNKIMSLFDLSASKIKFLGFEEDTMPVAEAKPESVVVEEVVAEEIAPETIEVKEEPENVKVEEDTEKPKSKKKKK